MKKIIKKIILMLMAAVWIGLSANAMDTIAIVDEVGPGADVPIMLADAAAIDLSLDYQGASADMRISLRAIPQLSVRWSLRRKLNALGIGL